MADRLPAAPRWLRDVPLAHRGLHGPGAPENTLAAFAAAAEAGVGVELDVHAARDGVPVVIHDPDLRRVAGRPERVADLDAVTVTAVPLVGGGTVPTLSAVLDLLTDVPVMVEIKNHARGAAHVEPAVAQLLAAHPGPACVASFDPRTVSWFRRHSPNVVRVQTAGPLTDVPMPAPLRWSLRTLRWLRRGRPHAVSYDVAGIDEPAVQHYREQGGTVVTWTVDSAEDLARARQLADNVIFEGLDPALVRAD